MGLFGNKDRPFRIPPQPKSRQIPILNPAYFQQIQVNIESWGGSETFENVSVGIANAVFNVGLRLFDGYNQSMAKDFGKTFADVVAIGPDSADHMINHILNRAPEWEEPLKTLLARLLETYATPPS